MSDSQTKVPYRWTLEEGTGEVELFDKSGNRKRYVSGKHNGTKGRLSFRAPDSYIEIFERHVQQGRDPSCKTLSAALCDAMLCWIVESNTVGRYVSPADLATMEAERIQLETAKRETDIETFKSSIDVAIRARNTPDVKTLLASLNVMIDTYQDKAGKTQLDALGEQKRRLKTYLRGDGPNDD